MRQRRRFFQTQTFVHNLASQHFLAAGTTLCVRGIDELRTDITYVLFMNWLF